MQHVVALIDKASKSCSSDAELARRLGVSRAAVSMMRSGKLKISPEIAALMADIAGEDAREAYINAGIENARGTRYEVALREILGKALAAGVAGLLVFSYSGDSTLAMETIAKNRLTINDSIHRIYFMVSHKTVSHRSIWTLWPLSSVHAATIIAHDTAHTNPLHISHPLRPS